MNVNNPWKKLDEKRIYENQWILVDEHKVINPRGNPGIYGKVSFKNRAIGIVAVDDALDTWLVGQFRYTLNEYTWEIPTDGGPMNEEPIQAAMRELKEETGLTANRWQQISKIHTSNSVTDEEGFIYLALELTSGETDFDETELITVKKVSLGRAVEMVMNNEITDSISIAGLLKSARILGV